MPPDLRAASFWPFAVMAVLLMLSVGASPKRLGWTDGILCAAALLGALTAGRNVSVFAVVVAPVIAYHLSAIGEERRWGVRPLQQANAPIAIANVLLIVCMLVIAAQRMSCPSGMRASSASAQDAAGRRDRLSPRAPRPWQPLQLLRLGRIHPPLAARRARLRRRALGSLRLLSRRSVSLTAEASPGWDRRLDRYGIETVIVHRTSGLANALAARREWRWAYSDDLAVVFERR